MENLTTVSMRNALSLNQRQGSILAIGNTLHHDIAGACNAGIDSVLITSGIHVFDLKTVRAQKPNNWRSINFAQIQELLLHFWGTRFV